MSDLAARAAELSAMNKDRLVLHALAKERECAELREAIRAQQCPMDYLVSVGS